MHTLRFVRRARKLGFSLDDIRQLVNLWHNPHRPSLEVKNLATQHIAELEARIQVMDFNGDGLSDILHAHTDLLGSTWQLSVLRNTTAAGGNPSSAGSTVADTHTVSRNETLWRIARRYGTTPRAIQSANDLPDTTIYPGQQLRIPATR